MKKIICLYGGPGSGKSTVAAGVFYRLKMQHYNVEMNREYTKDWIWEKRSIQEGDQTYIFAKQSRKERQLILNGLDFIITDSPLILTHYYGLKYDWLEQQFNTSEVMLRHHHEFCKKYGYKVEHFILSRPEVEYQAKGRVEDLDTARIYDKEIREMLESKGIAYKSVPGSIDPVEFVVNAVLK